MRRSSKKDTSLILDRLNTLQLKLRYCLATIQIYDHRTCNSTRCRTKYLLQASFNQYPELFFTYTRIFSGIVSS